MIQSYYRLEPLTPIHIGTGESLDPFSYVIRGDELHYIDLNAWVEAHPDPAGLAKKLSGELHAVKAHIAENIDLERFSLSTAKVLSREVLDEYRLKLKDPRNQLKIAPALKNIAAHTLLIPGSSLKGAIRTAVIDLLDREHGLRLRDATRDDIAQRSRNRQYDDRLKSALGDIGSNAFKDLKITDFEAPRGAAAFVAAKEVGRKPDKQPTPKDPCEVLPGACMGPASSSLVGKIGVGAANAGDPRGESLKIRFGGKVLSFSVERLAELCTAFYQRRYLAEKEKFYQLPHFAKTARALHAVDEAILAPPPGTFILRIGHYSHVECMTVTDNQPETRVVKGKQMPWGTTRTLAEGVYPFGWVRLVPCSGEEYRQGVEARGKIELREVPSAAGSSAPVPPPLLTATPVEAVIWEEATLNWNPGSATLTAQHADGRKALARLGADRTLVPEEIIARLKRGKLVKARVTLEQQGMALKIMGIEV